jgi:uncharacterized protein YwqG
MTSHQKFKTTLLQSQLEAVHFLPAGKRHSTSKFGGLPAIAPDFQWPSVEGVPMAFVAQICLADISATPDLNDLPREGYLHFFFDVDQMDRSYYKDGFEGNRVVYDSNPTACPLLEPPIGAQRYQEKTVIPQLGPSFSSFQRLGHRDWDLPLEVHDLRVQLQGQYLPYGPRHQMGGYPDPIQNDNMEIYAQEDFEKIEPQLDVADNVLRYRKPAIRLESSDWLLLLQLDSDQETSMEWADVGILYFWIRRDDLRKRDFSKTWLSLQCS